MLINIASRLFSTARTDFLKSIQDELSALKNAGAYKKEGVILGPQGVRVKVRGWPNQLLNFCSNNYLGLSSDPEVITAGKKALDSHGAGLSSVRFICGTQDIHKQLEKKIADFHARDDAILYAACFDANAGVFEALLSKEDAIISDHFNHASIIDGIRLSKAQKHLYAHCDTKDLEQKLIATQRCKNRLIVTDGVFSVDGDVAPLKEICTLAEKYNSLVFLDESHAAGFFGKSGRGTEDYFDLLGKVDIINSTLGKAIGGAMGGYTTSSKPVIDLLRQKSRPYVFSNSLAPAVVGSALKALSLIMENPELNKSLQSKVFRFRSQMKAAGFKVIGNENHPICPVMLGDTKLAITFADEMLKQGIYVIGLGFPIVPHGKARIRVQISVAHEEADIDSCVEAFVFVANKLGVTLNSELNNV